MKSQIRTKTTYFTITLLLCISNLLLFIGEKHQFNFIRILLIFGAIFIWIFLHFNSKSKNQIINENVLVKSTIKFHKTIDIILLFIALFAIEITSFFVFKSYFNKIDPNLYIWFLGIPTLILFSLISSQKKQRILISGGLVSMNTYFAKTIIPFNFIKSVKQQNDFSLVISLKDQNQIEVTIPPTDFEIGKDFQLRNEKINKIRNYISNQK